MSIFDEALPSTKKDFRFFFEWIFELFPLLSSILQLQFLGMQKRLGTLKSSIVSGSFEVYRDEFRKENVDSFNIKFIWKNDSPKASGWVVYWVRSPTISL